MLNPASSSAQISELSLKKTNHTKGVKQIYDRRVKRCDKKPSSALTLWSRNKEITSHPELTKDVVLPTMSPIKKIVRPLLLCQADLVEWKAPYCLILSPRYLSDTSHIFWELSFVHDVLNVFCDHGRQIACDYKYSTVTIPLCQKHADCCHAVCTFV